MVEAYPSPRPSPARGEGADRGSARSLSPCGGRGGPLGGGPAAEAGVWEGTVIQLRYHVLRAHRRERAEGAAILRPADRLRRHLAGVFAAIALTQAARLVAGRHRIVIARNGEDVDIAAS